MDPALVDYLVNTSSVGAWKICATAAVRSLLTDAPSRAESQWATRDLFTGHADGQWLEVLSGARVWYMQVGRSGRFSSTRPAGIADSLFVKVTEPLGPHFQIRVFLDGLAKRFASSKEVVWERWLRDLSPRLRAMGNGTYESDEMRCFLQGCIAQIGGNGAAEYCKAYISSLQQRHTDLSAPGYVLAYMLLLDRSWRQMSKGSVVDFVLISLNAPNLPVVERFRSLRDFVDAVLRILLVEAGEAQAVEDAVKSMQTFGEKMQREVVVARSVEDFYATHYLCAPWLYGAYRGYEFLADMSRPGGDQQRRHKISAKVCEERVLKSRGALDTFFTVCIDPGRLEGIRKQVSVVREREGDFGADMLADQFVSYQLLFPSVWKPYLVGQSDKNPMPREQ